MTTSLVVRTWWKHRGSVNKLISNYLRKIKCCNLVILFIYLPTTRLVTSVFFSV